MRGSVAVLLLAGFIGPLAGAAARAEGERAGVFDYYVMALSWSPSFCALEGTARGDPQCAGAGRGFVLHGLWPQFEAGWPSYCPSAARNPSRAETAAMADIMGSGGLAWYQWKKHGRCSWMAPNYRIKSRNLNWLLDYSLFISTYLSTFRCPLRPALPPGHAMTNLVRAYGAELPATTRQASHHDV